MYQKRDRLNKLEGLGYYIAISFASIVIGFGVIGLVARVVMSMGK